MKAIISLGPEGFRTEIKTGPALEHTIIGDEPVEAGGTNQGATAMGLLASALGMCTVATLRSYANLKNLALKGVTVEVETQRRTPSEQNEAGPSAKMLLIRKKISIQGDLTPEQRERMLQIAEKCPVNRALLEGVDMVKG